MHGEIAVVRVAVTLVSQIVLTCFGESSHANNVGLRCEWSCHRRCDMSSTIVRSSARTCRSPAREGVTARMLNYRRTGVTAPMW
jgi:hypothetical protein